MRFGIASGCPELFSFAPRGMEARASAVPLGGTSKIPYRRRASYNFFCCLLQKPSPKPVLEPTELAQSFVHGTRPSAHSIWISETQRSSKNVACSGACFRQHSALTRSSRPTPRFFLKKKHKWERCAPNSLSVSCHLTCVNATVTTWCSTRAGRWRNSFLKQDKTRQDKTRQDKTRHDTTRQDKTRQDKTRQDKTRQDKTRQDKTRQDKTRQDMTRHAAPRHATPRHDETRRDETRRDETRQDKTRQDKTTRQWTLRTHRWAWPKYGPARVGLYPFPDGQSADGEQTVSPKRILLLMNSMRA